MIRIWIARAAVAMVASAALAGCASMSGEAYDAKTIKVASTPEDGAAEAQPAVTVAGPVDTTDEDENGVDFSTKLACNLDPSIDTYKCFDGKFEDKVAESHDAIGSFPRNVDPKRPPKSLYYASGPDSATAPEMKAGRVVRNEALDAYLNDLLSRIVAHSPRPYPTMTAHILADFNYSAEATADGDIYVNLGMLQSVESEGELAAVLSHEASHIILGHHDRQALFEAQKELASGAVSAVAIASTIKQGQDGGGYSLDAGAASKETQTALAVASAVTFVANDVISSSWGREQEDEADLLGADMLVRAGFNPEPGATALERIASDISAAKKRTDEMSNRTQALEQSLAANPSLSGFTDGMVGVLGGALGDVLADARDWLRRSHLSPEDRRKAYLGYIDREHEEALFLDVVPPAEDGFAQAKKAADFDALIAAYEAVKRANKAREDGDFATAKAEIKTALSNPAVADDPVPREVEAQILFSSADYDGAIKALRKVKNQTLSLEGYYLMADILLAQNQPDGAMEAVVAGEKAYGSEMFLDQRIKIALQRGDEAGAREQYGVCLKGEDGVKERCRAVWKKKYPNDPTVSGPLAGDGPAASDPTGGLLSAIGGGLGGGSGSSGASGGLGSLGSLFE